MTKHINKDKKLHRFASIQKTTYYHKNEWQHKHGQYNSMVNEWSLDWLEGRICWL